MRLLLDITAHGWGHLSQTAPVLAELRKISKDIQVVVWSDIRADILKSRLGSAVYYSAAGTNLGVVMDHAFQVNEAATRAYYRHIHSGLEDHIQMISSIIDREGCDAIISNIGYLSLLAGKRVGIPTVAFSSLNWKDILASYSEQFSDVEGILQIMASAYEGADAFLQLIPGIPITCANSLSMDKVIARVGKARSSVLRAEIGASQREIIVLCAFGGMLPAAPPRFCIEKENLIIIGPREWENLSIISAENLAIPFEDLIASVDLVVSKPGYGIVAELASTGTPAILATRGSWPEERYLLDWLSSYGRHIFVSDIQNMSAREIYDAAIHLERQQFRTVPVGGEIAVASIISTYLS